MKNKSSFEFTIYNDRFLCTCLPEKLHQSMKQKGLIPHDSLHVHFCGLITYQNQVAVFLPRNSETNQELNKTEKIERARNMLKAIQRYKMTADTTTETADQGSDVIGNDSLALISELLDDYIANGLYARRTEEHLLNQGRTNWKRTINQMMPFVNSNNVFYPEIIGTRKQIDHDSDITKIHAQVIKDICAKAGWIAFENPENTIQELNDYLKVQHLNQFKIELLNRELNVSYSDRDIILLKNLIQYLRNTSGSEQTDLVIGIRESHGFWENMLDSCLMYKESINHRMTAPLYKINGKYVLASSKGHRTDTVLKHPEKKKFIITDAKYYGAHNIQSSPKLQDIVKQFYYAKAMQILEEDAEILNVFIFPGKSGQIESVHMAKKGIKKEYTDADCLNLDYPPIKCLYQDPIELVKCYSKHKYLRNLSEQLINLNADD